MKKITVNLNADGKRMARLQTGSFAQFAQYADRWFARYGERIEIHFYQYDFDQTFRVIAEHFRWERQQADRIKTGREGQWKTS